jgi:predicted porin
MKKSLLALAVLGAFAGVAHAQSSVTIYGIIDTGIVYQSKVATGTGTNTGSKFSLNSGVIQGSRLGFKGTENLGGGLSAVFNLEAGFSNDTGALQGSDAVSSSNLFRRKSVAGLAGGFGSVLLGRQTDFADTIASYTSVNDFGGWTGNVGHNLDRLEGTRTNNSISYTTNNINGLTGNLLYGFGEQAGSTSAGQAFGAGLKYDNGPLGLGLNYYQSKANGTSASDTSLIPSTTTTVTTNTLASNVGSTAYKGWNLVASYQFGPARVYGDWSRVTQDLNTQANLTSAGVGSLSTLTNRTLARAKKADIYEIGTAYSLTSTLKLLGAVDYTRAQFDGVSAKGKLTAYNIGTDYALSQRTDLYAFATFMHATDIVNAGVADSTGIAGNQTAVAVGIRHKF